MVKQTAIFVENQKGSLRRVTEVLHENGIRICALSTVDSPEFGIFRMILDDAKRAEELLAQSGFVAKECEVIAVELPSQSDMCELLRVIENGNVNINYFYTAFGASGSSPILILHAADMDETEAMLLRNGFRCLSGVENV